MPVKHKTQNKKTSLWQMLYGHYHKYASPAIKGSKLSSYWGVRRKKSLHIKVATVGQQAS